MIQELLTWIDEIKKDEFTIIGTHEKFADLLLHGYHKLIYRKGIPIGEFTNDLPKEIMDDML